MVAEPSIEHKRRWNAVILIILLLLTGTCLFYYLNELPMKSGTILPVVDSTRYPQNSTVEVTDTLPTNIHTKYTTVTETKNANGKTISADQKTVKEKGTLRLQSVQGFWFTYNGDIVAGKANGKGKALYENGNKYEGNFKDNQRTGYGTAITKTGEKYEGQWKNDRFNGKGKYTWENGDYYIGMFDEAKRHGNGKLYNYKGKLLQDGIWKNDKFVK